jgi:hypothetical protein
MEMEQKFVALCSDENNETWGLCAFRDTASRTVIETSFSSVGCVPTLYWLYANNSDSSPIE